MELISSLLPFINDGGRAFRFILIISRNKYEMNYTWGGKYIWTIEFNYGIVVWEKLAVYYSLIS